jgi:hypothetical protein
VAARMPSIAATFSVSIGASVIIRRQCRFPAPDREQAFRSALERDFEVGPADLDMRHAIPVVAVCEPDAAIGSCAADIRCTRSLEDTGGRRRAPAR